MTSPSSDTEDDATVDTEDDAILKAAYARIAVLNRTRNELIVERDTLQAKLDRVLNDLPY